MSDYKIVFIVSALLWGSIPVFSQDLPRCGSAHPDRIITGPPSTKFSAYSRENIIIPVVVHIVWNEDVENLSDEVVFEQIQWLNDDYSRQNTDLELVPSRFTKNLGHTGIQFCLADRDPQGSGSDGITRTFTDDPQIGSLFSTSGKRSIKHTSEGGQDAWDVSSYLNIWIGERNDFIGDSTFPQDEDVPPEEDGVVIKYTAFGNHSTSDLRFNKGRTLTHEIGHYFNLLHLFGSETGCNNDDDLVEDTPLQSGPYFGCSDDVEFSCGSRDMDTNFMNFRNDECMYFFTMGQANRMVEALFTYRYDLLKSGICESTMVLPPDPLKVGRISTSSTGVLVDLRVLTGFEYDLVLFDRIGRRMWQSHSNVVHRYEIGAQPLGIYFITLQIDGLSFVRKVFIP